MSKSPLRGKVAIVTGGSRGIGLAIAQALVAEGVQVAITGRSESHLSAARPLIEAAGPGAVETLRADVRTYAEVERAIAGFVSQLLDEGLLVESADTGSAEGAEIVAGGTFETPVLSKYTDMQELLLLDPIHDIDPSVGWPFPKAAE